MPLAALSLFVMAPAVLYVSPSGDDSHPGSRQKPLRSLAKALESVSQSGSRTIELLPGVHAAEGLQLGDQHSGLTIRGSDAQKSIIAGGPLLSRWTKRADGVWTHPWPSAAPVRCLTRSGSLVPRARFPHTGRLKHESSFAVNWMSTTGGGWQRKPTVEELTTMKVNPGLLPNDFKVQNAEITVFHMWDESTLGVKSYDPATGGVVFSSELGHPAGAFDVKDFVVWNTVEGLKQGSWMHDRTKGEILYWPKPGEEPKPDVPIRTAAAEQALKLKGAHGVTLSSLTLTTAGTPLKSGGFGTTQYDGVITAESCRDLTLSNVTVKGTGGWGVRTWNCDSLTIERCLIQNCGAGGVRAEGVKAQVIDSTIQNTGLHFPSAPGLMIQGALSSAKHNFITDSTYSGIIGGGDDQLIEGNRIRRVMTVMHDGAAIYAGFAKRMIYRGNWVSDIEDTGGYGASSYYLDEGAEDCVVEGNLSEGVYRPSQNHMAKNCIIKGNVFLIPGDGRLEFARCTGFRLEGNLIQAKGSLTFRFVENEVSFGRNLMSAGSFTATSIEPGGYGELKSGPLPTAPGVLRGELGLVLQAPGRWSAGPLGLARSTGLPIPDVSRAGPRKKQ